MNDEEKKAIEKFVEKCNKYDESVEIKGISVGEEYRMLDTVCKALNLIEKLQKENKELEEINNELEAEKNEAIRRYNFESIPVYLVEEKIEELNNSIDLAIDNSKGGLDEEFIEKGSKLLAQKKVLQELLEKRR